MLTSLRKVDPLRAFVGGSESCFFLAARVVSFRPLGCVVDVEYFFGLGDSSSVSSNEIVFSFWFSCELSSEWLEPLSNASD